MNFDDYKYHIDKDGSTFVVRYDGLNVIGCGDSIEDALTEAQGNLEFYINYCKDNNIPIFPDEKEDVKIQTKDPLGELFRLLKERHFKITTVESCTAGLLSATIASRSGASAFLEKAFVTYSDQAKIDLGVSKKTIDKYSVYSAECAREMAYYGLKEANSDVAISVTGLAGPEGDGVHPVGTVYIGIAVKKGEGISITIVKRHYNLERNALRNQIVDDAIDETYNYLRLFN